MQNICFRIVLNCQTSINNLRNWTQLFDSNNVTKLISERKTSFGSKWSKHSALCPWMPMIKSWHKNDFWNIVTLWWKSIDRRWILLKQASYVSFVVFVAVRPNTLLRNKLVAGDVGRHDIYLKTLKFKQEKYIISGAVVKLQCYVYSSIWMCGFFKYRNKVSEINGYPQTYLNIMIYRPHHCMH